MRIGADGRYLCEVLGTAFTAEQLAVITAPLTPQLVVAGAGSGKTTVMAARVVHAIAHHGVEPAGVLGLTFTNKAAGQLAQSVRATLRALVSAGAVAEERADDTPTIATYHSYAAAIVRDHALRIGREPVTTLLTEAGRWQLAMRVVRRASGPFHHLTWQPATVAAYLLALDGEMAEHLATPDDVRAFDAALVAELDGVPRPTEKIRDCARAARARDELVGLVETYRAEKHRLDLIDYGDQVALAAEIARTSDDVCALERERFPVVMLDEYQDTGVAQRLLLARLFGDGHAVTAVGDPNQAIYGWRGASVGNLLRFREHFGGTDSPLPLMTSFRCGGRILDAANAIAAPLRASAGAQRRPQVEVAGLTAAPGNDTAGEVVVSLHARVDDEADWVGEQLAAAIKGGIAPGKIAVLCRRRQDFPLLRNALTAREIPVEVVGLGGLLEMPEVADLVATLRVLVDPTANAALLRLLTGPRWRIGPRDLAAMGRRARRLAAAGQAGPADDDDVAAALRSATQSVDAVDVASLLDVVDLIRPSDDDLSAEAVDRLLALRAELTELRSSLGQPIVEIAAEVIRRIGLDVELEAQPPDVAAARVANLAAFCDHAAQFSGLEGESDLASFLGWLDAAVAAESGLEIGGVSDANTVKLLTVHKAKGLEWDVVAVPGLTDKVFPSSQSRIRWTSGSGAQVLPYPCRGDAGDLPRVQEWSTKGLDAFKSECTGDDADEERRLGYVAMTRPRALLLASGYWWGATRRTAMGPSALLQELHDLAADGGVRVDTWVASVEDTDNPVARERADDVAWPAALDADALAARRNAAAAVRAAMQTPVLIGPQLTAAEAEQVRNWDEQTRLLVEELRRTRHAVREVPLPRRLTASQVVALAHDPDELAQMLARPLPVRPVPQARRGSRFHRWVEELYAAAPLLEPEDLPGAGDADLTDAELAELQQRFLDDGWGERRPVAVEQPFELLLGGRLVRGRIDAVYPRDGGGYDVIDYKTGSVPKDFAAASMQLSVYRLAWADLDGVTPDQVDAGFLYVRTGTLKRPDRLLSHEELTALLSG